MISRLLLLLSCVAVLAGCVSKTPGGYKNAGDDVFGDPQKMEYPQKIQAINEMLGRLFTDPDFEDFYAIVLKRAEERGHKRPTVIVGDIEDHTRVGGSDMRSTGQMRKELKTALRKTRKFVVIDFYERTRMKNIVLSEPDAGAKADNIESLGAYESGDLVMSGDLSMDNVSGRVFYHFLNLRMTDPVTGTEIWSDTVKVCKE